MEPDYFKTWGTPWLYLMAYHGIVVFRQGKDCPSCITYLLLVLN